MTGPKETASIFATYPAPYLSLNNGFLDQVDVRGRPGRTLTFVPALWDPGLLLSLWVRWDAELGLSLPHSPTQPPILTKSDDTVVAWTVWVREGRWSTWQLLGTPLHLSTPRSWAPGS